jgi:LysR family hydrogen peroxide-inducible transcriptional activator
VLARIAVADGIPYFHRQHQFRNPMNLRDLSYIVAVAEQGHFGHAAAACHVSQPTLSGQILKLEQELGVPIFERVGKQVRLTPVGGEIVAHARRTLASAGDIVATARASRDPLAGPIRLGVIPTLAPYLMPFVLPRSAERLPQAPLMLVEDLTGHLIGPLAAGELDAALIATEPGSDRFAEMMLFEEPFWLVMPAGHPLAAKARIGLGDIDPKSLLLLTDGHCLRDQALELCGRADIAVGTADVRAASLETLLHLTAAKYGLTLVPRLAVADWPALTDRLVAKPIDGARALRRIRLVYRRDMPRRRALEVLADVVRESVPDCVHCIADRRGLSTL